MKKILFIPVLFVIIFGTAYSQPLSDSTGLVHRLDIEAKGQTYEVQVVGNFDVSNYEFVKDEKRLTVIIHSTLEDNLGEMIIPVELMSGNFTFHLDGAEFFPNNRQSEKISFVSMTFNGTGQHTLDILSSEVLVSNNVICFPGLDPINGECPDIPLQDYTLEEVDAVWEEKRQQCNDDYLEPDNLAKCFHLVDTWRNMQLDALQNEQTGGGGCLIATAAYGSELSVPIQQLRELRDDKLMKTQAGTNFMESFNKFYYSFSPAIADYERQNPIFKDAVKLSITPMIASLSILNHIDLDSEEKVIGYGISVILLNIGMYGIIPAGMILAIKKLQK